MAASRKRRAASKNQIVEDDIENATKKSKGEDNVAAEENLGEIQVPIERRNEIREYLELWSYKTNGKLQLYAMDYLHR